MGYACPVCAAPQADGEHLANHLAFSAILRHDEHEEWLDEHAPDWSGDDPESLAATVVELVDEVEYPDVFEDTTDQHTRDHAHGHEQAQAHEHERAGAHGHRPSPQQPPGGPQIDETLTPEAEEILAEARELTEERRTRESTAADESDDDT